MSLSGPPTENHTLYKYNHLWTLQILEELVLEPLKDVPLRDPFEITVAARSRKDTFGALPLAVAQEEVESKRAWIEEKSLRAAKFNPLDTAPYPGGELYKRLRFVLQKAAAFPVGKEPNRYPIPQRCHYMAWAAWYTTIRATWASEGQKMLERARKHMARFAYWLPTNTTGSRSWDARQEQHQEHRNAQDDLLRQMLTDQKEYLDFLAFERGISEDALRT